MILAALFALHFQTAPAIRMSVSPFAAQYGTLRAMMEAHEAPSSSGLRAAVDDLAKLEAGFPAEIKTRSGAVVAGDAARVKELYWRTIDALTFSAGSPDMLADIADLMPQIGGHLDTDATMKAIRRALDESKGEFEVNVWPDQSKIAQGCIAEFAKLPEEKRTAALQFIMQAAGIAKAPKQVGVLVVPRMAGREGMTVRTPSGTSIVIGAGKYAGADFDEVVFHETTHVLDTFAGADSLFGKLRAALKAAGRPAFELEQVPHVAMFLLAAEATRRNVDAGHRDVGETYGAYSRGLEPLRKVVEPALKKLIAHEIDADGAVKAIMTALEHPEETW